MVAMVDRPRMQSQRPLTVADLAVLPDELPSGPVKYELDQGRLLTLMAPPGSEHGRLQLRIGAILLAKAEKLGLGEAFAEVAVVLRKKPDTVLAPDAAFVARRSLPVRTTPEGYLETIPDLVVEVRSKNDTLAALRAKANQYLSAGVKIVWLIDPMSKTVTVCRSQKSREDLRPGDMLTAKGVIPGFQISIADLFAR